MEEVRVCKVCGKTKPLSKFGMTRSAGNGELYHRHECRQCTYARQEEWREKNKEKIRIQSRENARKARAKLSKNELAIVRKKQAEIALARRSKLKAMAYKAYGGYRCACCGETEVLFLSIDHVFNDGYLMRKNKTHGSGALLYEYLYRIFKETGKWPDGFQVLCMNCQHGKSRNGGICPHKQGLTTSRKA